MTDFQIQHLLGRDEIDIDLDEIAAYLRDQAVLVTGAGGSIGSELCRQISRFAPRQLILLGRGEQSIYDIHLECRHRFPDVPVAPVIADIRDPLRIRHVFEEHRPHVVFHFCSGLSTLDSRLFLTRYAKKMPFRSLQNA